ncbi:MAG: winged helix-turn-helix domain-containing protein [Enterococcus sp.]
MRKIKILILTHNILNECSMQEKLQKFNYEVFVSKTILDDILRMNVQESIRFFQLVILSESLTNNEVEMIVPQLKEKQIVVFREYLNEPIDNEKSTIKDLAIDKWIPKDIGMDLLRELISDYAVTVKEYFEKTHVDSYDYDQLFLDFTKNQQKFFQKLYGAHSSSVSREELCRYIWKKEPSNSNLAQLSVLSKDLRRKLINKGFSEDVLETVWGKGYYLKNEFYDLCRSHNKNRSDYPTKNNTECQVI